MNNMIEVPTEITKHLCDAERFVEGLKLLANECNMTRITYNGFGPITFTFADGSLIGNRKAWINAGLIKQEN